MSKTKQGLSLEELERDAWPHNPEEVSTVEWQIPEEPPVERYQVDGAHYQGEIQPVEFFVSQDMDFLQANVCKYASRHKRKNGYSDVRKLIHYGLFMAKFQYGKITDEDINEIMSKL